MITSIDYLVIGFYFAFMLVLGLVFRHFNRSSSDYFRGGGSMLWWMCGTSVFMVNFSAWTFTGAASMIYHSGTLILALYLANAVAYLIASLFTAHRFRQMRTVTYAEAVRSRFDPFNEQFQVWVQVPIFILSGAIYLNALGVFMSAVFGVPLVVTVTVVGIVILVMALVGGAWAVVAGDFIQMLIIMSITIVAAVLALSEPRVGGLTGLIRQVPTSHFNWMELARPQVVVLWVSALVVSQGLDANNIARGAGRFLMVKNGKHARYAALIPCVGMIVFPVIWLIPPMAASITHPNLAQQFPGLEHPAEAAYVAISLQTMPAGLVGLLVCAIFAATMSTVDAGLNGVAGVMVRNFYLPVLNPRASERRQLVLGKIFTAAFGLLIIVAGVLLSRWQKLGLFDLVLQVASKIEIPLLVPMLLAMFIKRAPAWAAWTSIVVGFVTAWIVHFVFDAGQIQLLMGWRTPLSDREAADLNYGITVFAVTLCSTAWYLFGTLFYGRSSREYRERVEQFFRTMNTPIDPDRETVQDYDRIQYRLLGWLSGVYGAFVVLLALLPNNWTGRLCFVFCGGFLLLIGLLLGSQARDARKESESWAVCQGEQRS